MKSDFSMIAVVMLAFSIDAGAAQRSAADASSAHYPSRPIRLIVPQAPGGSNDIFARYIGNQLGERLGRQVVVDNRPGAEGSIGTEMVARATPDGYTLLMASAAFTMNPAVHKLPYDPVKDFDWAAMLGSGAVAVTVGAGVPVASMQDLLALGRSKPGYLTAASAFPHIRSGKLKALATGGAKRAPAMPELPTLAEAGVAGYEASIWWALATPAGTPAAVIDRLNAEVAAILKLPETEKRFAAEGAVTDIRTPAEIRRLIPQDLAKWAKVARDARTGKE